VTRAIQPPVATRCCCQFGRVDPPNQSDELDAEVHKAVEQMPVAPGVEEVVDDLLAVCQKDSQEDPEAVVVSMPMSFTASTHTEHTVAVIHVTRPVAVKCSILGQRQSGRDHHSPRPLEVIVVSGRGSATSSRSAISPSTGFVIWAKSYHAYGVRRKRNGLHSVGLSCLDLVTACLINIHMHSLDYCLRHLEEAASSGAGIY